MGLSSVNHHHKRLQQIINMKTLLIAFALKALTVKVDYQISDSQLKKKKKELMI